MRIVIDGREYPGVNHRNTTPLHMMELQAQSRHLVEGGIGMSFLERMARAQVAYQRAMKAWQEADEATRGEPPLVPDEAPIGTAVVLFLTRRKAGDKVSFEEAAVQDLDRVEWLADPGDEVEPVDPTTAVGSSTAEPDASPGND